MQFFVYGLDKIVDVLAYYRAYRHALGARFLYKIFYLAVGRHIRLIERHHLGQRRELWRIICQLLVDLIIIFDGIASFAAAYIHDVYYKAGALDVAKKIGAQSGALARPVYQSRYIGDDKAVLIVLYNA